MLSAGPWRPGWAESSTELGRKRPTFIDKWAAERNGARARPNQALVTSWPPPGPPIVLSGASLPHQLRDLPSPPAEAYLWGRLPPGPRIGIVGTRTPSREGFRIAFEVARQLAALGMTIVSGGALGIDRAAHLGALRARGKTLVVAPLWYERAYPEDNRKLFAGILAKGGAYLTVSDFDAQPIAPEFARRNEMLVALCDVLLLGEAGVPSGTLMAARFARRAGVPQFLMPWSVRALDARGTQSEFDRGVRGYFHPVQLVQLLEGRGFDNAAYWERSGRAVQARLLALEAKTKLRGRGKKKAGAKKRSAGKQEQKVMAFAGAPPASDAIVVAIAAGATTIDAIAEATQLGAAAVQHRVLRLTLEGMVLRDGAGLLRVVGEKVE